MDDKLDEKLKIFSSGKNFNEVLDNLKRYWWETEKKPEMVESIDMAMETSKADKDILELMKALLKNAKIKKMEDYLEDM